MVTARRLPILLSLPFTSYTMTRASSFIATAPRRSARLLSQNKGIACIGEDDIKTLKSKSSSTKSRKRTIGSSSAARSKKTASTKQTTTFESGQKASNTDHMPPLFSLGTLVKGTVFKRPSSQIKSPYVADVTLDISTTALAHAPALDCAGMCVPGKEVYMSARPPGGKTTHAIELVVSDAPVKTAKGVLVGAHPRLGEMIALEVLNRGLLKDSLPLDDGFEIGPVNANGSTDNQQTINVKQQVTLGDSRVDFEMTIQNKEKSHRVIFEVKNVVCADYEKGTEPLKTGANHCVVIAEPSEDNSYQRSALFPWAKSRSQTFEDKKVCSARALKHLRNLHDLSSNRDITPVVLFIVNRSDCQSVRACHEACPVFRDVLEEVTRDGAVRALGVRVKWTEGGECYFDGVVPVDT